MVLRASSRPVLFSRHPFRQQRGNVVKAASRSPRLDGRVVGAGDIACLSATNTVSHACRSAIVPFCQSHRPAQQPRHQRLTVSRGRLRPILPRRRLLCCLPFAAKSTARRDADSRADAILGAGVAHAAAKRPRRHLYADAGRARPAGCRSWSGGPAAAQLGPLCHAQRHARHAVAAGPLPSVRAGQSAWPRCRSSCSTSI